MRRCSMCHQEKPESEFAFRSIKTGVRQDHCRACHAAYRRQHYLNNRDGYIAREVARMDGYRIENRLRVFEYLSSHACVDCGETDTLVLEFDHRDRATKRTEVARLATSKPWRVVFEEILKCDVRCGNCHRRRTALQLRWAPVTGPQQSPATTSEVLQFLLDPAGAEFRVCTGCNVSKPIEQFSVKNKKTGRRGYRCRSCVATYGREHYRRNKSAYLAKNRRNKPKYKRRNRSKKAEYVADLACVDCGEKDPVVLEFDHRDGAEKLANVSRLMAAHSWAKVSAEIAKCDLRCVNCHRKHTAAQFGWMSRSLQMAAKMALARE
jgi:hypothetical protein